MLIKDQVKNLTVDAGLHDASVPHTRTHARSHACTHALKQEAQLPVADQHLCQQYGHQSLHLATGSAEGIDDGTHVGPGLGCPLTR